MKNVTNFKETVNAVAETLVEAYGVGKIISLKELDVRCGMPAVFDDIFDKFVDGAFIDDDDLALIIEAEDGRAYSYRDFSKAICEAVAERI